LTASVRRSVQAKKIMSYVDLNILYADEKALVCVVPSDNSKGIDDDFGDNGENVLLFLKEDDLDLKLDQLRAS